MNFLLLMTSAFFIGMLELSPAFVLPALAIAVLITFIGATIFTNGGILKTLLFI